jgi:Kef-type K+ transport system membrane component KefB
MDYILATMDSISPVITIAVIMGGVLIYFGIGLSLALEYVKTGPHRNTPWRPFFVLTLIFCWPVWLFYALLYGFWLLLKWW